MPELSHDIARHLPFLRRYARALTGSQERGDRYVHVCLETLLQEPQRIAPDRDVRLQLFALFHDVWAVVSRLRPRRKATAMSNAGAETGCRKALPRCLQSS